MKVTQRTRNGLQCRRHNNQMRKDGWEYIGEGGGDLWKIYRGDRIGWKIIAAQPSCDGMGIWVKYKDMVKQ